MAKYDGIRTPTPEEELEYIDSVCAELAGTINHNSSLAIEIGSAYGACTVMLAKYFNFVVAIDPFGREEQKPGDRIAAYVGFPGTNASFSLFMKNIYDRKLTDRVFPVISTSIFLRHMPFLAANLIFVDDGHTYDDCSKDLQVAYQHISQNGIVIVHDYLREGQKWGMIGVEQAVNEVIESGKFKMKKWRSGVAILTLGERDY